MVSVFSAIVVLYTVMETSILGHFRVSHILIQMVPFFFVIVLPSEVRLLMILTSYHEIICDGK